ncbi:MAG: hypothetical protein DMF80_08020 [Acidobacteria bacterium]|nr:MAG: hypothetical protein DMF80_08020 [Acidobacteriota bacterium]PYQ24823.1 MAG: hypothetical protein DMF81_04400 [Acidobacteriota bacterium]
MVPSRTSTYRRFLYASLGFVGLLGVALRVEALAGLALGGFALLLVAWRQARAQLDGLTVARELYPSAFEDDTVAVSLALDNRSRRPAWLVEIGDCFGPAVADRQAMLEPGPLRGSRRRRLTYRTTCSRPWGIHAVGPLTLAASDAFGLFHAERSLPDVAAFAVFPRVWTVSGLEKLGARPSLSPREATSPRPGQSLAYLGVRDYRSGDDLRRIHWPATARRGTPTVKEHEVDLVPYFTLFVDLDRAHRAGTGLKSTLEYLVRTAACVVWTAARRGDLVQVMGEGARSLVVAPGAGTLHATLALYELIRVQQDGRVPLLELVEQHRMHLPGGSTAALLAGTIFLDLAQLEDTLAALQARGVRPAVLLVNKDSFLPIDRRAAPREEAAEQAHAVVALLRARDIPGTILAAEQDLEAELARPDLLGDPS